MTTPPCASATPGCNGPFTYRSAIGAAIAGEPASPDFEGEELQFSANRAISMAEGP